MTPYQHIPLAPYRHERPLTARRYTCTSARHAAQERLLWRTAGIITIILLTSLGLGGIACLLLHP